MSTNYKSGSSSTHLESVHLLRGIAAMVVVIHHSFGWFPLPFINTFVATVTQNGQLGVAAFFVISGFVLPLSLEADTNLGITPSSF